MPARLAAKLRDSRQVLVFTGAGISTGSGIPDFRGPQGIWHRFKPVYYQEFLSSEEARIRHWTFKLEGWQKFRDASPNAGHRAIFDLDQMGKLVAVVTQNIDGLHHLAGHAPDKIIELHGTNRRVECCACGLDSDPEPHFAAFANTGLPPVCQCGGFLKPATVSFGQPMPMAKMNAALVTAQRCDAVLAVGSTLEVEPAASIPRTAKENGAFYAIVNLGATAQDHLADIKLEGDASELLVELVRLLSQPID